MSDTESGDRFVTKTHDCPPENLLLLRTNSLAEETNRSRNRKSAKISRALAQRIRLH
ncbi:hypothetical protein J6590_076865 [Homalodisca vitripennis]|nr:hypothetical protein J6590_076865 [Homalodisca vitripennis]